MAKHKGFLFGFKYFLVEEWDLKKFEVHVDTALLILKVDGELVVEIVKVNKELTLKWNDEWKEWKEL